MRRVEDPEQVGEFEINPPNEWNKGFLHFICPKGRSCGVPIRNGQFADTGVKRWGFDGNCDAPTLNPSINCNGPAGCGWHGFIRNGRMTEA